MAYVVASAWRQKGHRKRVRFHLFVLKKSVFPGPFPCANDVYIGVQVFIVRMSVYACVYVCVSIHFYTYTSTDVYVS
jgi:hypothetical protein